MGRHRVKSSMKREARAHPDEIWTDPQRMLAWRGRWGEFFGNDHPLHLELGVGRGQFLSCLTEQGLPVNFIGMELKPDRCVTARRKVQRSARSPFIILNEAGELLPRIFAPSELDRIYVNFPDPWPTWPYRERRMFGEVFLRIYQTLLKDGGQVWFKSDQPQAWRELLDSLPRHLFVEQAGEDLHSCDSFEQGFLTEYEKRYLENGARTHFARLVKRRTEILERAVTA